jgi:hypothetical protein
MANPKNCGELAQAVALRLQFQNPFKVYPALRTAQLLAIRSRISNPGHSLAHLLSDRVQAAQRQRTARVDVLLIGNELDAERPKLLQGREKVSNRTSK